MIAVAALSPPPLGRGPQAVPQSPMIHRTVSGDADHLPASVSDSSARAVAPALTPASASAPIKSARMRATSTAGPEGSAAHACAEEELELRSDRGREATRVDTGFWAVIGSRLIEGRKSRGILNQAATPPFFNPEMPSMSRTGSWT